MSLQLRVNLNVAGAAHGPPRALFPRSSPPGRRLSPGPRRPTRTGSTVPREPANGISSFVSREGM
jgi:hypothetical protein